MDNHSDVVYTLKASYLEVYNEKVQHGTNLANIMCTCLVVDCKFLSLSKCRVYHVYMKIARLVFFICWIPSLWF